MNIKSRTSAMNEWKASPVAESVYNELVGNMDENGKIEVTKVAEVLETYVKGIQASSYKEVAYTLMFIGKGLTPVWLGGEPLVEEDKPRTKRESSAAIITEPVVVKEAWERFI